MHWLILMINFVKLLCEIFVIMLGIDLYILHGKYKHPCMLQCHSPPHWWIVFCIVMIFSWHTSVGNLSNFWEDVCFHSVNSRLGSSWHLINFHFTYKNVELVLWAFTHFRSPGFGDNTAVLKFKSYWDHIHPCFDESLLYKNWF